jgi:hypothetical protein
MYVANKGRRLVVGFPIPRYWYMLMACVHSWNREYVYACMYVCMYLYACLWLCAFMCWTAIFVYRIDVDVCTIICFYDYVYLHVSLVIGIYKCIYYYVYFDAEKLSACTGLRLMYVCIYVQIACICIYYYVDLCYSHSGNYWRPLILFGTRFYFFFLRNLVPKR